MADLLSILGNSAAGLQVHQAATATAGHNLQNVNTPGYSRQRAELQATLPAELGIRGQIGRGVSLLGISQARDQFVERQMPGALSSQARSSSSSRALTAMNGLDPDAAGGMTEALGAFYSALRDASQNPSEPGLRAALVAAGRTLGFAFNRTTGAIDSARAGIDAEITGVLAEVNDAASAVARLNKEIKGARASGSEPNDLLDIRQKHLDKLAELTGAVPVPNATGDVTVMIPGGGALVSGGRSATLTALPNPANGGHLSVTFNATDGSPPVTLANGMLSGRTGGLLEARDVALAGAETRLDQLAFDLGNAFNTVHRAGFGLDGSTNRNFFSVSATAPGAARTFAVDPAIIADPLRIAAAASAATTPGDASNLHALTASETQVLSSGSDAGKTFGQIVTDYGTFTRNAAAMADQDGTILNHLQNVRESVSGVSVDEELVNLTKSQRAFEAVMKVLTTADSMLETLMSLK